MRSRRYCRSTGSGPPGELEPRAPDRIRNRWVFLSCPEGRICAAPGYRGVLAYGPGRGGLGARPRILLWDFGLPLEGPDREGGILPHDRLHAGNQRSLGLRAAAIPRGAEGAVLLGCGSPRPDLRIDLHRV